MPISDWSDLFPQTVTIASLSSRAAYGKQTFGSATSYSARVVDKAQKIRDPDGQEVLARTVVWVQGTPTVTPQDRITLPDGTTPPILNAEKYPDESGDHHVKVFCG